MQAEPLDMTGHWTRIRPVTPADYGYLFTLYVDQSTVFRWGIRGRVPSCEEFPSVLWDRVLTQFLIEDKLSHEPAGLVQIYSADFRNQHAKLACVIDDRYRSNGWLLEGVGLAIEYGFRNWAFRKFFVEMIEFNAMFGGELVQKILQLEGRYSEFEFYDGRYWDMIVSSIARDRWQTYGRPLMVGLSSGA